MSSDNGWILRFRESDNKYVLQHYMASADELPDINSTSSSNVFDDLETAVRTFAEREELAPFPSEYGLSVQLPKEKIRQRHCHYEDDPDTCTVLCET